MIRLKVEGKLVGKQGRETEKLRQQEERDFILSRNHCGIVECSCKGDEILADSGREAEKSETKPSKRKI